MWCEKINDFMEAVFIQFYFRKYGCETDIYWWVPCKYEIHKT